MAENNEQDKKQPHPANTVPLDLIMNHFDAMPNQDNQSDKWKLNDANVVVNDYRWYDLNNEIGGVGAISLTMHALGYMDYDKEGYKHALNLIRQEFDEEIDWTGEEASRKLESNSFKKEKKPFNPPVSDERYIKNVYEYLTGFEEDQRQLPSQLIQTMIDEGRIYADSYKNCIFLGQENAEVRSTYNAYGHGFSGCCEGSNTENSGFIVPAQTSLEEGEDLHIAQTEAAIDALSYTAMNPSHYAISCNGAGRFILQYKITNETVENGGVPVFAFDKDLAGDKAAQKIFNAFYLKKLLYHKLGITGAQYDEWIKDDLLHITMPRNNEISDNDLFFGKNIPFKESNISFTIDVPLGYEQKLHDRLENNKEYTLPMKKQAVETVLQQFKLKRARPLKTKDWNEEWKSRPKNKINFNQGNNKNTQTNKNQNEKQSGNQSNPQNRNQEKTQKKTSRVNLNEASEKKASKKKEDEKKDKIDQQNNRKKRRVGLE